MWGFSVFLVLLKNVYIDNKFKLNTMKKVLKIVGAIIALIVLLLVTLPYLFKDKIEVLVKEEGNKMLNAEFDFRGLDISLISNFPLASITIEDFYLKGVEQFENDTLVAADEITAAVNVMSLFGDEGFDIRKVLLDGVSVKAIVMPDSTVNWDVMKPTTDEVEETPVDTTSSPFRIKLQQLTINDFNLIYDDRLAGMYARVEDMNAGCSGDFGSARTMLALETDIEALTFSMDGVPFLNRAHIAANMNVDADLENNKFTLDKNTLQLNAIKAAIDGWVALTDEGLDMDLKLNSNEIGFKEVLSLVPAIYSKDFEGLKTDGSATLSAWAKGSLKGDSIVPQFNVAFDVKDAMFHYPALPTGVNKININAKVENPGGSIDATVVNVAPFSFVLAGNPFSVALKLLTPISDMQFDASAKGKLDLGKIKDVYPLEDMTLNGIVDADMSVSGRMSYIEKEQYDNVKAQGSVRLNNMLLNMEDMPDVNIKNSVLSFNPRYLELSQTTVNIGKNDVSFNSKFENYMGFALKGTTLKGTLNVSSNYFNLNDFISSDTTTAVVESDTAAMGVINVPENIDFRMQANFAKVLFDNMTFDNMKGELLVKEGKVDMKNLSLNTMGGNVVVNGYYKATENVEPEFDAGLKLSNIGFAQAYKELDMVKKLAPIFNGLTGDFSGSMKIFTKLDATMSPVIQTLTGSGSLSTRDLSLNNVTVIQQVADIIKKPSLKDTRVKDLNVEFTIKDGRVNTKPFNIKLGDCNMLLSGSTGLDQTIDYRGEITLPASVGKLSQLGTVDMTIGGSFTSPKVGIDMEALAKKAASKAAEGAIEKLLGGKSNNAASDSTKSSAEKKAEVVKDVFDKAKNLFKKK